MFQNDPSSGDAHKKSGFIHPRTGENVFFESALFEDYTATPDKWRNYSQHVKLEEQSF